MSTVDILELQIQDNSEKAISGLNALAATLTRLKSAAKGGIGLKSVINQIKSLSEGMENIPEDGVAKLERLGTALSGLSSLNHIKISPSIANQIGRIGETARSFENADFSSFGALTGYLQHIADLGNSQGFQNVADVVKSGSAAMPALTSGSADTIGTTNVKVSGVTEATSEIQTFTGANVEAAKACESTSRSASKLSGRLRSLRENVSLGNTGLGKFLGSLKRIAMYRAVRAVLGKIAEGFKTGINNIYAYSRAAGTSFASSMDAAASSMLTFKNSIGAAVAPLITSLIPVLQRVCSWLVTVNNLIAQFIAALSGKAVFTAATQAATQYGGALESAGSAAKALQDFTLGFDELNVLNADSGSGGGGGGAVAPDYSSMFEEREVGAKMKAFVEWMQEHLPLLKTLAIGIGAAFLAWKIASLFTKDLGKILGFAMAIGGTVVFVRAFIDAWKNGVNWDNMATMIGGAAVAVIGLGMAFGPTAAAIGALIAGIAMLVIGIKDWIETGELSKETMWLLVAGIMAIGVALSLLTGSWIPVVIAAVAAIVVVIIGYWDEISAWLAQAWEDIKGVAISVWNAISSFFVSVWNGIKSVAISVWQSVSSFFTTLWTGIKTTASNIWHGISSTIIGVVTGIWSGITTAFTTVKNFVVGCFQTIKTVASTVWNSIWGAIKGVINSILGGIEGMVNGVINGLNFMINALNKLSFDVPDWVPLIGGKKFGFNIKNIGLVSIPRLSDGGMPSTGQVFMAREKGPELVGTIGNRTAVMNNDQIVQSVSDGVRQANGNVVNALFTVASQIIQSIQENGGDVVIGDDVIGRANARYKQKAGTNTSKGAFAYVR